MRDRERSIVLVARKSGDRREGAREWLEERKKREKSRKVLMRNLCTFSSCCHRHSS